MLIATIVMAAATALAAVAAAVSALAALGIVPVRRAQTDPVPQCPCQVERRTVVRVTELQPREQLELTVDEES